MKIKTDDVFAARDYLEETQEVFGARFGVSQGTIARWEIHGLPQHAGFMRNRMREFIEALNREIEKKAARSSKKKTKSKESEFSCA